MRATICDIIIHVGLPPLQKFKSGGGREGIRVEHVMGSFLCQWILVLMPSMS